MNCFSINYEYEIIPFLKQIPESKVIVEPGVQNENLIYECELKLSKCGWVYHIAHCKIVHKWFA